MMGDVSNNVSSTSGGSLPTANRDSDTVPVGIDHISDPSVPAPPEAPVPQDLSSAEIKDSILYSVKNMLGILPGYTPFDDTIILHINSTFAVLHQLGVGPKESFSIADASAKWSDFITELGTEMVRSYMFLRVKLLFDALPNAAMATPIDNQLKEYEWRLRVAADDVRMQTLWETEVEH